MPTLVDFHECCDIIIADQDAPALNWCVNYAKAGLVMTERRMVKTQAIYIVSNMDHWRGKDSGYVRGTLNKLIKEWA